MSSTFCSLFRIVKCLHLHYVNVLACSCVNLFIVIKHNQIYNFIRNSFLRGIIIDSFGIQYFCSENNQVGSNVA